MMYSVRLTVHAHRDISDIIRYITIYDSHSKAEFAYNKIMECLETLIVNPQRGHVPYEMEKMDVQTYLEIHFKPYRIMYSVENDVVRVHCILDGRRDLEDLLRKRLYLNSGDFYKSK